MPTYVRSAAELVASPVRWLWDRWLPAGKLVLLDGDPGTGKSTLACELAARLSRGDWGGEPSSVLLINAEDDPADTTVPRLVAAGADLARVHLWDPREPLELPGGLDRLRAEVVRTGAKLVVIDPLSAHLSRGTSVNNDQSARRALTPLARLAEELGCSVLLVRHLRKQTTDNALHRGLGSIGVIAAVRVAWLLGYHPGGEERRVLTMTKSNLGPVPAAKVFRVGDGRVAWAADEEWLSPADVIRSTATGVARWLQQMLDSGPKKSDRVKAEAAVLGISERTLWRAKQSLRVVGRLYYRKWYWCLPGQDPWARFGGLEPLDDLDPKTKSVLEPMGETLGPMEDDCRMRVREGMTERQRLREATRVLRADERAERGPRRASRRQPDVNSPVVGERSPAADPSPPAAEAKGGREARAGEAENEGPPPAAGSRRFDPAPAGSLDVVIRLGDANADWSATVIDRLYRFDELVKCRAGEGARLLWEPAWTGPVGDGRLRLVLSPRDFPPERLASLGAWAEESLAHCESARLAA